jgi:hypothetical protein
LNYLQISRISNALTKDVHGQEQDTFLSRRTRERDEGTIEALCSLSLASPFQICCIPEEAEVPILAAAENLLPTEGFNLWKLNFFPLMNLNFPLVWSKESHCFERYFESMD